MFYGGRVGYIGLWRLYFVYLPDKERYSSQRIKDNNYLKRSEIIALINNLDIPLIDIHDEFFINQADPIEFFAERIYGHYSPDGYNEISKVILKNINLINWYVDAKLII